MEDKVKVMRERLEGKRNELTDLKEEIKDFAAPIPDMVVGEPKHQGPIVKLSPQEYAQLQGMPDEKRPAWLAWMRWIKSHSPASMSKRELFFAGYESAVRFHKP